MSNDKQPLKQAFKKYYVDKSLTHAQLDALCNTLKQPVAREEQRDEKQRDEEQSDFRFNKKKTLLWGRSIAASFFVFVLMFGYIQGDYFQTPALITSAYADISKDISLNNGMPPSMQQWLDENNIEPVPQQYPVEMSKFCRLDQSLTAHFRIAGKEQGKVNVFIHQGERPLHWSEGQGRVKDMNWKLVKVRKNLTLIVLYTQDMREKSVQYILDKMIPELTV